MAVSGRRCSTNVFDTLSLGRFGVASHAHCVITPMLFNGHINRVQTTDQCILRGFDERVQTESIRRKLTSSLVLLLMYIKQSQATYCSWFRPLLLNNRPLRCRRTLARYTLDLHWDTRTPVVRNLEQRPGFQLQRIY